VATRPKRPAASGRTGVRVKNSVNTLPTVASAFEAGANTRRTLNWRAPTVSPNSGLLASLTTLRDRSRTAVRNDGYAKGAIDKLVYNLIGWGIKPLSKANDAGFRKKVQQLFLRWTDESDADGLLDFYGQQTQVARAWLEGGEVFIRLRPRLASDGLSVPLQLQVIEPELCPHNHTMTRPNGNRVRAGIEFDAIGRRVAYWFHPSRPGDQDDYDTGQLKAVPASSVIHLYNPLRPGQLRGGPHLTQALVRLYELDKFDDATLLRQQIANLFAAFIKREQGSGEGETVSPLTGLAPAATQDDRAVLTMEPGVLQELAPGESMEFSDPPDVGSTYVDFVKQQLSHISAATGVPYEVLTGDFSNVNDRTVRIILNDFRRMLQAWQQQILGYQFCRRVWSAWMDQAWLSNALPLPGSYAIDRTPWIGVAWMPQRWPYLNPVQDVEAEQAEIRAGFTSRSAVVSEHGEDTEEIDAAQAADNARADQLELKYDSDGRFNPKAAIPLETQKTEDDDRPPSSSGKSSN
jgi:lambda family phage portal protein